MSLNGTSGAVAGARTESSCSLHRSWCWKQRTTWAAGPRERPKLRTGPSALGIWSGGELRPTADQPACKEGLRVVHDGPGVLSDAFGVLA